MEIHHHMLAYGISSPGSAITFERTKITLNTNDYDAAVTYWFEVYGTNSEATPRSVQIVNSSGGGTGGVVALDASTLSPKLYRVSLTPSVGSDNYRVKLLASGGGQGVLDARIVVVTPDQPNKIVHRFQLVNSTDGATTTSDTAGYVDSTTSTSYTQALPQLYPYWYKDLAAIDGTVSSVVLDVNMASSVATSTASVGLHTAAGTLVTGAECSTINTAITNVRTTINWTDLADTTNFEIKIKASAGTCYIYTAVLEVTMTAVNKFAGMIRLSRQISENFSDTRDNNRLLYTAANFNNCVLYYEATGKQDTAGTQSSNLASVGAVDTGGTPSTTASVSFSGTAKERVRSSAITLTDTNRYIHTTTVTSGAINVYASYIIVQYKKPASGGTLLMIGVG